jgi:hypothetical protein
MHIHNALEWELIHSFRIHIHNALEFIIIMQHAFQLSSVLKKTGVQFPCKVLSFRLFCGLFLLFKARLYT